MSRTILDFTPEGLKRRLAEMERQLADIQRRGAWRYDNEVEHPETTGSATTTGVGQVLTMSATADTIASGVDDYVAFGAIVDQYGFATVETAGSSISLPHPAVYVLTYEHAWDSYTGGGTIQVELDGTVIRTLASGSEGQTGRGSSVFAADAGQSLKIKVSQASGSTQTFDGYLELGISDRKGDEGCLVVAFSDDFDTGSASPGWSTVTGAIATGGGPDGSNAWDVSTGAGGTASPALSYVAPAQFQTRRWILQFDFYCGAYVGSTSDHVLLGPSGDGSRCKTDITSTGAVLVTANGLRFTSAAGVVSTGVWQSWVIDTTLGVSDGAIRVTIDGAVIYETVGITTATAGQVFAEAVFSIAAGGTVKYDNIDIVMDTCT